MTSTPRTDSSEERWRSEALLRKARWIAEGMQVLADELEEHLRPRTQSVEPKDAAPPARSSQA